MGKPIHWSLSSPISPMPTTERSPSTEISHTEFSDTNNLSSEALEFADVIATNSERLENLLRSNLELSQSMIVSLPQLQAPTRDQTLRAIVREGNRSRSRAEALRAAAACFDLQDQVIQQFLRTRDGSRAIDRVNGMFHPESGEVLEPGESPNFPRVRAGTTAENSSDYSADRAENPQSLSSEDRHSQSRDE